MKKLGYISLFAAVMLLGACNNYEDFDFNEVENGGYVDPAGSGTEEDPYNVSKALLEQNDEFAWVKGYIVGQVAGADISTDSEFDAPFHGAVYDDGSVSNIGTNILVAAKDDEKNQSACLIVQLPKGDVRTALELLGNPDNDGKEVELYGKLTKYFGVAGMKETKAAKFDGTTIGEMPTPPDTPDTPQDGVLFSESFKTSLGSFTIDDKNLPAGLSFVWQYSSKYQCAKGSAYYQQDYEAESWLVSPSIALNGKPATLTFDHAVNYMKNSMQEDLRLMYSVDEGATWTEAAIPTYPSGNSFDFVSSGEIGLPAAATVKIAFAYKATAKGASTWELNNVKVIDKASSVVTPDTPDTPDTPEVGEGNGTKQSPYNIAAVMSLNSTVKENGPKAWVKGYIVGQINGKSLTNVEWDAPFNIPTGSTAGTNIVIADNANEKSNYVPVQLPSGAVRTGLNLPAHPEMDGKEVLLYGELVAYFGTCGVKNTTCAIVDGVVYGVEPVDATGAILEVPFTSGLGGFTVYDVLGDQTWKSDATYGAKMSAFADGASHANEDWLISPVLDLTSKSDVKLTFEHAINKGDVSNLKSNHTLWISKDYTGGDPTQASWEQVVITTYPDGTSWNFVSSGEIVLPAAYMTSNVHFAFKYLSSDVESATWEIKNLVVK